jgi:hypothetical protein
LEQWSRVYFVVKEPERGVDVRESFPHMTKASFGLCDVPGDCSAAAFEGGLRMFVGKVVHALKSRRDLDSLLVAFAP